MRRECDPAVDPRNVEENVAEALTPERSLSQCYVLAQAACPIALLAREPDAAQRHVDVLRGCTALFAQPSSDVSPAQRLTFSHSI